MDRLFRIFNGFKIPTYLLFDGDKNSNKSNMKEKTLELIRLYGDEIETIDEVTTAVEENYAVFENKLECTLKEEIEDYEELKEEAAEDLGPNPGKPLTNKFIANKLRNKITTELSPENVLPETIIEVINKIKDVTFTRSFLRTPSESE